MTKIFEVKCPQCQSPFIYSQSAFRPFCSERCKMIDLGHWLEESYRVPLKSNAGFEELDPEVNSEHYPVEEGEDE